MNVIYIYFIENNAEPDGGTEKEGEQRKRKGNETEIERNDRRRQWKTKPDN